VTFEDDTGANIPGNPSGYIRDLIGQGVGPTAGLDQFRNIDGGAIQDSRWFDLYHQVEATINAGPQSLGVDPYSVPTPDQYVEWQLGRGGQYMTQVEVQVRDRDTGIYLARQFTYVTDTPHTGVEAEDEALAMFGGYDNENQYGETVMGATATTYATTTAFGT
jgi:hypothetical protein